METESYPGTVGWRALWSIVPVDPQGVSGVQENNFHLIAVWELVVAECEGQRKSERETAYSLQRGG